MAERPGHDYKFGIEEEFFLAAARSRGAPRKSIQTFHDAAKRLGSVERELLENQVEICSKPTANVEEARVALSDLRDELQATAREHGLKLFAAGTHPTAVWSVQKETDKPRYRGMMDDLQITGRRSVVAGMHVHVEVPRPEARVDIMRRIYPYLPLLLALSTSSPFYNRRRTGLHGYRLRAYAELPRTGLPELFDDADDYSRYVRVMTATGAVIDPTYFWWHIRPSTRYPTLELRVADSCTRLDDTLTVAQLYRCLVRLLSRRPDIQAGLTGTSRGFVMENLWRAERDGTGASLIDEAAERTVTVVEAVDVLLDLVAEDAAALGGVDSYRSHRTMAARVTTAA
ncbi:YbdK family carboxylate-amine ligase [Methylobacterium sp. NEAU 140]|uniref:carboxylate-amine ligase n=1 Tax=Methylobacterium sp. NEAU 140 TaxID=3064945 RepID=UPI002734EE07|nr:YbdK family carboxylate-amine ligase [Methylobacterium sp. NEAU 140]MDP4027189.1 YbdK family carboxylate-amine ligase [Methylobacterium sp. NEAU 140]